MNKKIFFLLSFLSYSALSFCAQDTMLNAIKNLNVDSALLLADSSLTISTQEKDKYAQASKEMIDDLQMKLVSRFSRSDVIRLGKGLASLTISCLPAYIALKTSSYIGEALDGDVDSIMTSLVGIPLPVLGASLGFVFGVSEIYKGFTKYDRKQMLNKAHAIAALVNRAKTAVPAA